MTQQQHNTDFRFPKIYRLKKSGDFEKTYHQKQRASDQHLLIFVAKNSLDVTRCGLSVSKKHGNAVCRNRKKRLLREAFRLVRHQLPAGYDLVLIPRVDSGANFKQYQKSLLKIVNKIVRRMERSSPSKKLQSSHTTQTDSQVPQ